MPRLSVHAVVHLSEPRGISTLGAASTSSATRCADDQVCDAEDEVDRDPQADDEGHADACTYRARRLARRLVKAVAIRRAAASDAADNPDEEDRLDGEEEPHEDALALLRGRGLGVDGLGLLSAHGQSPLSGP